MFPLDILDQGPGDAELGGEAPALNNSPRIPPTRITWRGGGVQFIQPRFFLGFGGKGVAPFPGVSLGGFPKHDWELLGVGGTSPTPCFSPNV